MFHCVLYTFIRPFIIVKSHDDVTSASSTDHTGGTFGTRPLARIEYDSLLYVVGVTAQEPNYFILFLFYLGVILLLFPGS